MSAAARWLRRLARRLDLPFGRRETERSMDEEMRFHLDMEIEERIRGGMTPQEARTTALRDFGGVELHKEEGRDARGGRLVDDLVQDTRFTLRMLLKNPGFTAVAVATLALGIGANSAIFSVVHHTLLRPLPYEAPDRIVTLWERGEGGVSGSVADENLRDWRRESRAFAAMAYYSNPAFAPPQTVLGADSAVRVRSIAVSEDFFPVFGIRPVSGRLFAAEEHREGGPPVAVVSHGFWQSHLGGDPAVLGRTLSALGESFAIVGVLPPGFRYPGEVDLWVPAERWGPNPYRTAKNWAAVGRLRDGVTLAAAQADLDRIGDRMVAEHGEGSGARPAVATPLHEELVGDLRRPLLLLLGAAGLLLLIACTNLASTLLARAAAREHEVVVRSALGCRRTRLVRQMLTESLILAALGSAAGLGLALWLLRLLEAVRPATLQPVAGAGIDVAVLGFTLALTVLTALLFGLVPALRASGKNVAEPLRAGQRGTVGGARQRVWHALMAAEVALTIVLLVGSALLVRSFLEVLSRDAGFDADGVLIAEVSLPHSEYPEEENLIAFYRRALTELGTLPGVEEAGLIQHLPLGGVGWNGSFDIEGRGESSVYAGYRVVSPGYFRAMGIPLVRGRAFELGERADSPHVAIVNRSLAAKEWPGEDPIGRRVGNLANEPMHYRGEGAWLTIVGVVEDVRAGSLLGDPEPEIYVNVLQHPSRARDSVLALRTSVPPGSLAEAVGSRLRELGPQVPVELATMNQRVLASVAERRFAMLVLGAFALVALLLAAVGVYGVVSYAVARRTREIGIRLALGASPAELRALVQWGTLRPLLLGAALGTAAALALGRALRGLLWGVGPADPVAFAAAVATLASVAWLASYLPALRTTRVDPLRSMRTE